MTVQRFHTINDLLRSLTLAHKNFSKSEMGRFEQLIRPCNERQIVRKLMHNGIILSSLIFVSFSQLENSETELRNGTKLSGLKQN